MSAVHAELKNGIGFVLFVTMKERTFTNEQNERKLQRTEKELQIFKDFHKNRMESSISNG